MRIFALLAVTCLLAWGLWTFLGDPRTSRQQAEDLPEPAERGPVARRASSTTGTLVVRVRTPAGPVPRGARAGYLYAGEPRLKPVGPTGEARFTDAPLGPLTVVARAPGFGEVSQRRSVQAGVRTDVVLILVEEGRESPR